MAMLSLGIHLSLFLGLLLLAMASFPAPKSLTKTQDVAKKSDEVATPD